MDSITENSNSQAIRGISDCCDFFAIGCINLNDRNLLRELRSNPGNFYITVSNAEFPNGAVRGQLRSNF